MTTSLVVKGYIRVQTNPNPSTSKPTKYNPEECVLAQYAAQTYSSGGYDRQ